MKNPAKKLVAMLLMAASASSAYSYDIGVQAHGLSHHFSPRKTSSGVPWNEVNTGFGIVLRDGELSYQAGAYKNSLSTNKATFYARYAIVDYQAVRLDLGDVQVSLGAFAGAVGGYPLLEWHKDGTVKRLEKRGFSPAVGLSTRVEYQNFNMTFRLTPGRETERAHGSAVLSMETGYKF